MSDRTLRDTYAGDLRAADAGRRVALAGWVARRRDHGGVVFVDLRDSRGIAQVVVNPDDAPADPAVLDGLRAEYCVAVGGTVRLRPEGGANPDLPSGESRSSPTISRCSARRRRCRSRSTNGSTSTRTGGWSIRYLDLRRPRMAPTWGPVGRDRCHAPDPRRSRVPRRGDPDPGRLHPGGRPRHPGAEPAPAGSLLRPAAVAAAVQAVADDRRGRAVLPDRPLLPRRGLPRRPPARVHPARHRGRLLGSGRGPRHPGAGDRGRGRGNCEGSTWSARSPG
jgi:hypothetical protein